MWREWWWSATQYLCTLDSKYESELKYIETHADVNQDPTLMNEDEKKRSMFLYGLLASLLRGRLLTVLQGIPENNGYEALRQLVMQCQLTSRNRSLGILNALMSWKEFDMKGALRSQIVRLEEAFREYDKISLQPFAAEMKFAILLRCITGQLRMHINVSLKEDASYDALRELVLQYDRGSIKWTEAMVLGNARSSTDDGGPVPMEIDRVKGGQRKRQGQEGQSERKGLQRQCQRQVRKERWWKVERKRQREEERLRETWKGSRCWPWQRTSTCRCLQAMRWKRTLEP